MITSLKNGHYKLIETRRHTKILYLGSDTFAWVDLGNSSEILVASRKLHKTDCVLSVGRYKLHSVHGEPDLSDHIHLQLEVGRNIWQDYLLLSGLPSVDKLRTRIIPTTDNITVAPDFALQ